MALFWTMTVIMAAESIRHHLQVRWLVRRNRELTAALTRDRGAPYDPQGGVL